MLDVADKARAAAMEFVAGAKWGWGRRQLASWLLEHYEPVILAVPTKPRSRVSRRGAELAAGITDASITRLVARTRRRILELVTNAQHAWTGAGFAREMIDSGFVVGVSDDGGGIGYVAAHAPDMRLVDRVTSLFLADFLTRPRDYDGILLCPACDELSFRWEEVHEEGCDARMRSGVVVKPRGRPTRPGI